MTCDEIAGRAGAAITCVPLARRRQARHLRGAATPGPEQGPSASARAATLHAAPCISSTRPRSSSAPAPAGPGAVSFRREKYHRIWRPRRRRRRQGRRHHLRGGRGPQHPDRLPLHPAFQGAARQGRRRPQPDRRRRRAISSSRSRSAPRSSPTTRSMSSPTSPRSASASSCCKGGDGGRGNASYKTSTNRAPRQHGTGWPGEELWVWLRLKLLADAGLVGLPNAGKSTFLNAVSNAKAKVGDYPFTTLHPKLGVVRHKSVDFVLADIPGLIEGAAEGAGIGDRFLGHVERTRVLLHLVDANVEDVAAAYRTVRDELDAYGAGLDDKLEVIALNKCRHDRRRAGRGAGRRAARRNRARRSSPSPARPAPASTRSSTRSIDRHRRDRAAKPRERGGGRTGRRYEPHAAPSPSPAAPASSAAICSRVARAAGYRGPRADPRLAAARGRDRLDRRRARPAREPRHACATAPTRSSTSPA